ncbi:Hypothetical predicted protein, partial [Podarcis lilfordi]
SAAAATSSRHQPRRCGRFPRACGAAEVFGPETRSRHGHTEGRGSPLPKAISNPCMIFIHCAKEQPSTARNGGTSMVVGLSAGRGEDPREIQTHTRTHAHPSAHTRAGIGRRRGQSGEPRRQ